MSLVPIIFRELRAQSRQSMTCWLRVVGIGAILGVMALVDLRGSSPSEVGGHLFNALNAALFVSIWIFVPLLTADAISREKREGTLGLLFLTPLTPVGIVLGKSLTHALRAVTLFLAVLPALALPFLLGGLSWKDCVVSLLLNGSALVLALAAGLLASTLATDSRRAMALALALSLGFAWLFMSAHLGSFYSTLPKFLKLPFTPPTLAGWLGQGDLISEIQFLVNSFFLLPGIGLYFSMQRVHFVGAWLLTCAAGLLVPALSCWWTKGSWPAAVCAPFLSQFAIAIISQTLLRRDLSGRKFALGSA